MLDVNVDQRRLGEENKVSPSHGSCQRLLGLAVGDVHGGDELDEAGS